MNRASESSNSRRQSNTEQEVDAACGECLVTTRYEDVTMNRPFNESYARRSVGVVILLSAVLSQACSRGAAAPTGPQRISGTVKSLSGQSLTVSTATGPVSVQLASATPIASVVAADRSQITDNSYLGIGSEKQPDGSLRAVEITVFPESMRGTGEGNYAWNHPDIQGGGRMTNGTAGSMKMTNGTVSSSRMTNGTVTQAGSGSITLSYQDSASKGTQAITIPPDVPIVRLEPGMQTDLTPGAHVVVFATKGAGGALSAARVLVG
jgi:hypothetical protein